MDYRDPLVLVLNITVILILLLLILPVLFNKKERLDVRISFAIVFLCVVVNCISNLIIFYFENSDFLPVHFTFMCIPFLFGPAVYFYARGINEAPLAKLFPHLIFPAIIALYGLYFFFLDGQQQHAIMEAMKKSEYLPYNIINTLVLFIPVIYFVAAKIFVRKIKLNPEEIDFAAKKIKKNWSDEFVNYILFSVFSFLIISAVLTYLYKFPQPALDLVGMPIYFPFIYAIVAVRNNMVSKELELEYLKGRTEYEHKLSEQRMNISRDLHDNIGAYANSLISKIDYLSAKKEPGETEELKDVKEHAEHILSLLRQTIWVLNNDEIDYYSAYEILMQYTLRIFKNTGIKPVFREDIVENNKLTSEEASHIFSVIQEALQNVLKHSDADEVTISMSSNPHLKISIEDNGKGDGLQDVKTGNGILNMKSRAKKIGMKFSIDFSRCGTLIQLETL